SAPTARRSGNGSPERWGWFARRLPPLQLVPAWSRWDPTASVPRTRRPRRAARRGRHGLLREHVRPPCTPPLSGVGREDASGTGIEAAAENFRRPRARKGP